MKLKFRILWIALLCSSLAFSQYNKPVAVSYETASKAYYVLNNGNGTVVKLDTFFNTSTVISGLYNPKDILFADLGTSKVILVLDSMQIKVFDQSTNSLVLSIAVPNSSDLRAGVVDKTNSNVFYLSDADSGTIIKGTVGPPPFYAVSFSTLAKGIDRPAGLLFDSKNRLLVVTDTTDACVLKVNTTTGVIDTMRKTNIFNMNTIREDAQGNFFVTNHGDSYLYRFDANFNNLVRLTGYNKPSGMYVNTAQDLMVLACTGCQKIYFNLLHVMQANPVSNLCPGDSFIFSLNPSYNGIGTYGTGNQFIVEISDSTGSFASPVFIRSLTNQLVPLQLACRLPAMVYGSNHLIRIRATNPAYASGSASLTVNQVPVAYAYKDTLLNACPRQNVKLGSTFTSGLSYRWLGPGNLTDTSVSAPIFSSGVGGVFQYMLEVRNGSGCKDTAYLKINVANDLKINGVPDTLKLCSGQSVLVGEENLDYVFSWSPAQILDNPSKSQVTATPTTDTRLVAHFTDTAVGCSGSDSVELRVFGYPLINGLADTIKGCEYKDVTVTASFAANTIYLWQNASGATLADTLTWIYNGVQTSEKIYLNAANQSFTSCAVKDSAMLVINQNPPVPIIIKIDNVISCSVNGTSYVWYKNGQALPGSNVKQLSLTASDNGVYRVEVYYPSGCSSLSDSIVTNIGYHNLVNAGVSMFPNPANRELHFASPQLITSVQMYTTDGRKVISQLADTSELSVSLENLPKGYYTVYLELKDGTRLTAPLVKH